MKLLTHFILTCLLLVCTIEMNAQDTLCLNPVQTTGGDKIQVDLKVINFQSLISLQYTMNYDPAVLHLDSVGNLNPTLPSLTVAANFGLPPLLENGTMTFSWFYVSNGITLADNEILYTFYFTAISNDNSEVVINYDVQPPLPIVEAYNSFDEIVFVKSNPFFILGNAHILSGNLFQDMNDNCLKEEELGLASWQIELDDGTEMKTAETDENGDYNVLLSAAEYEINVISLDASLVPCESNMSIDLIKSASIEIGMTTPVASSIVENDVNNFQVYPNPSNNEINFEWDQNRVGEHYLQVYNSVGKILFSKKIVDGTLKLYKEEMKEGIYFYSIKSKDAVLTNGKFVFY